MRFAARIAAARTATEDVPIILNNPFYDDPDLQTEASGSLLAVYNLQPWAISVNPLFEREPADASPRGVSMNSHPKQALVATCSPRTHFHVL